MSRGKEIFSLRFVVVIIDALMEHQCNVDNLKETSFRQCKSFESSGGGLLSENLNFVWNNLHELNVDFTFSSLMFMKDP